MIGALALIVVAPGLWTRPSPPPGVLRQGTGRIEGTATIAPVLTMVHRRLRRYYRLIAWYDRSHPVVTKAHVEPGQTAHADLRIPVPVER